LHGGGNSWRGEVLDISRTGIHLQLARRFESNAILKVEVVDANAEPVIIWLVHVRWVRQVTDELWSVGCSLNRELTEEELDTFLDNIPPTVMIQESK
jgi:hypothetical protein